MITIPLSDVVAFLTRRGVDLACLEGAPCAFLGVELMPFDAPWMLRDPSPWALYLGRNTVCPAAMGWATAILHAATQLPFVVIREHGTCGDVTAAVGCDDERFSSCITWYFGATRSPSCGRHVGAEVLKTPVERLRAVLLHEMGRA